MENHPTERWREWKIISLSAAVARRLKRISCHRRSSSSSPCFALQRLSRMQMRIEPRIAPADTYRRRSERDGRPIRRDDEDSRSSYRSLDENKYIWPRSPIRENYLARARAAFPPPPSFSVPRTHTSTRTRARVGESISLKWKQHGLMLQPDRQ